MSKATTYAFAGVELDTGRRRLWRKGTPVAIQKKPLDLLIYLIEHRDRAVGKDEILQSLWPDEFVNESSLVVCVAKIRKALGEDSASARIVETLHGYGYRFVAEVEGGASSAAARAVDARAAVTPLVGREQDTARLRAAWQRACAGERSIVLVSGDGGIGKTALIRSFLAEVDAGQDEAWVLRGECLDLRGGSEPFLPLLDAWTRACRRKRGDVAIDVLRRAAPGWLLQLHGVVGTDERVRLHEEARGTMPKRLLRMLGNAFNELAAERPVILVIEDLHWADPATLDALARLAHDHEPAAFLVLVTFRANFGTAAQRPLLDFVTLLERNRIGTEIALERLDEPSVRAFLESEAPEIAAAPELCSGLFERTRGIPLFLQAAVRHLMQGGQLDEVPATLRRMIEVEIDSLDPAERRLVEAAATVGADFAAALVAAAIEAPLADVEEALLDIVRRSSVLEAAGEVEYPDGSESRRFRFRHPYYVDVVLDRSARSRQRHWHRRIAERWRDTHAAAPPGSIAVRIARHFELSGDIAVAMAAYEDAVKIAQVECSYERIVTAATAALVLLPKLPTGSDRDDREIALRMALGPALLAIHGYGAPVLRENCERGLEVARAAAAVGPQFLSLLTLSAIHQTRGDGPAARARAEELVALSEQALPPPLQQLARGHLGQILSSAGEFEPALEYLEAALETTNHDDGGSSAMIGLDPGVILSGYLANLLLVLGYPERAKRELDAAIARARRSDHRLSEAAAYLLATYLHIIVSDEESAAAASTRFVEIAVAEGLMGAVHDGLMHELSQMLRGADEHSIDRFAARIRNHARRGLLYALPLFHCVHAEALARQGRVAEGLAALDAAIARVEDGGERIFLSEIHRLRGVLRAKRDSTNPAVEADFIASIDIARAQGARWYELRATVGWARLLHELGRGHEARPPLAAIYDWFTEGFDTPDLGEAAALLRELDVRQPRRQKGGG